MQNNVGGDVFLPRRGWTARYADAWVDGVSERCKRALDFSQLRSVVAKAAGSVNLASGFAAKKVSIGRLSSPLLGIPVMVRVSTPPPPNSNNRIHSSFETVRCSGTCLRLF
jgi:hypothetical protein